MYNHPESAIEMGVVPPEAGDEYIELHKKLSTGIKEIEIDVPMTKAKLMHRLKYNVVFDEGGKPVKAYGCAVVLEDEK